MSFRNSFLCCFLTVAGSGFFQAFAGLSGLNSHSSPEGKFYIPSSDNEVIEVVSRRPSLGLRPSFPLLLDPVESLDVGSVVGRVRSLIQSSRLDGDSRHLTRALTLLKPWVDLSSPPIEILMVRATVLQSLHRFDDAKTDLEEILRRDPRNGEAWLLKAILHTVHGEISEAKRACLQVVRFVDSFTSSTTAALIGGMNGGARSGLDLIQTRLGQKNTASIEARQWAHTVAGDLADRLGEDQIAEKHFLQALELSPDHIFSQTAWADFLLDRGRASEVVEFLGGRDDFPDGLRLRLTEALQALGTPGKQRFDEQKSILRASFDAASARNERTHLREEARFYLHVLHDPLRSLELAKQNWAVQREPPDVRLIAEAALSAKNSRALADIAGWIRTNRFEDVRLNGKL